MLNVMKPDFKVCLYILQRVLPGGDELRLFIAPQSFQNDNNTRLKYNALRISAVVVVIVFDAVVTLGCMSEIMSD